MKLAVTKPAVAMQPGPLLGGIIAQVGRCSCCATKSRYCVARCDEARALVEMGLETYWPRRWYFDPKSAFFADCRALQHFVWTEREWPITQVRHLVVNAMLASGTDRAVFETFLRREFKTTTKIARLLRLSPA
jgi:hypothetical protein